ncbi:MAG: Asp-tRNA(Asn)/Glu-tRNA(Gln) amidotransferase subunit GatC [Thermodesulfobacteriota bacterium]
MKIDRREVENVARLARLEVTDQDVDRLTGQIDGILTYMEKLNELDTTGLEPMAHSLTLATPYREDEVKPSLDVEEALANAPEREGNFIVVPRVI